jgi:hypothetical protein
MQTEIEPENENENVIVKAHEKLELLYLRYSRNSRNRTIFFKTMFFFLTEMAFVIFAGNALITTGVQAPYHYFTTALKFFCVFSVHIMQAPQVFNGI